MKSILTPIRLCCLTLFLMGAAPISAWADTPFIGEIKWVSFNYSPKGWAFCNGQMLQINQNQALFSLLGTTFGGDGRTTFALPDLRGRAPIHVGPSNTLGQMGGEEAHTLTISEMPAHTHQVAADPREGTTAVPTGSYPAKTGAGTSAYGSIPTVAMGAGTALAGGSQPHQNMKPFIALNCIIALQGIFPSPN